MTTRSLLGMSLLLLLACQPAAAGEPGDGEFLPLRDLPRARVAHRSFRDQFVGLTRRVAPLVPPLRGLIPPTRGDLRLAVVLVEFEDARRPAWGPRAWERSLFSRGVYRSTPTGQPAHGSMRDYYLENSSGALDISGRVFDWIRLDLRRADLEDRLAFSPGVHRRFFRRVLDALLAREGRDALHGTDALAFVVAGPHAKRRGRLFWPHSALFRHGGRFWRYYMMHAGERRFEPIGVHCHEMGHVLGLLDKYGVGRQTGLGQWCLMATGAHGARPGVPLDAPRITAEEKAVDVLRQWREELDEALRQWLRRLGLERLLPPRKPSERPPTWAKTPPPSPRRVRPRLEAQPLHFCAVCKDRLGWSRAAVLDPRRAARLFLTPVEEDASQVARVLLDPRGRETLYLEYRAPRGFDALLPGGGLLVWRVGSPLAMTRTFVPFERVELIPAHGIRSIDAPLRAPASIPFPAHGKTSVRVSGTLPEAWTVELSDIACEQGRLYLRLSGVR